MKTKFKKVVSLFMSAIMTVSALSLSGFSTFAETNETAEQTFERNDSEIQYDGLFGSMLSDEINESVESNQANASQDYAVYKIYHDPLVGCVGVDYHAKNDCTLVVCFYNDEGTELIKSVNKELKAEDKGYAEIGILDSLPDHYLIKAFIIGSELLNPLSKPCVYNKYTKQMQEILNTTMDSFSEDEDRVVNIDENRNNNFFVLQNDVIEVTPTETTDIYKGKDENGNYIFENVVEIAKLKKGDRVFINTAPEMAAFIVESIETDGNITVVTHKDAKLGDFIKFMKFDSAEYTGETYSETQNNEANGETRAQAPRPLSADNESDDPFALQFPTIKSKLDGSIKKNISKESTFEIKAVSHAAGSVTLKEEGQIEIYYDFHLFDEDFFSVSADINIEVELSVGLSCDADFPESGSRIPIFESFIANLYFNPHFNVSAQGSGVVIYERELYLECDTKNGIDFSFTDPVTKKLEGNVTIDFAAEASVELDITAITVLKIVPRGGLRIEINSGSSYDNGEGTSTVHIDSSGDNVTKEEPYIRHDCKKCCDVEIKFFFEVNIVLCIELFGISELGVEFTINIPVWESEPVSFYINEDGIVKGKCPNKSHRIILNVYENVNDEQGHSVAKKGNPVNKAKFLIKTKDKDYISLTDDKGKAVETDENGRTDVWVKDEILNDSSCIIRAISGGNVGQLEVGKKFRKDLRKANSFDIILDNDVEIPEYPKTGNCGVDPSKMIAYVLDGDNGDVFDPDTQCIIKNVNDEKISIKVPDDEIDFFIKNKSGSCTNGISITDSVKYTLDENGEIRFDGFGCMQSDILQKLSKNEMIKNVRIGFGVKTVYNIKTAGTNEDYLYGLHLIDVLFRGNKDDYTDDYTGKSTGLELYFEGDNGDTIIDGFAASNKYVTKVRLSFFERIGEEAFYNCTNLSEINMPETLKTIDEMAFSGCSKLENIYFYYGLGKIGRQAFYKTAVKYIDIPASVTDIGAIAFAKTPLKKIIIRNPDCSLGDSFVPENTVIFGYTNSTAHSYANKNGNPFVALDPQKQNNSTVGGNNTIQNTVTTAATTVINTPVTTKATTVVTNYVSPEKECVMIAVNDKINENSSANDILNNENLRFFDQSTADDNGVASFSYVPNENEEWSYMFISEAVNNVIQKTIGTVNKLKTINESIVTGDANGDGTVDMSDAVLIMQALANPNKYGMNGTDPRHITKNGLKYADADGDGFTVNDAQRIQLYLLGKISSLD